MLRVLDFPACAGRVLFLVIASVYGDDLGKLDKSLYSLRSGIVNHQAAGKAAGIVETCGERKLFHLDGTSELSHATVSAYNSTVSLAGPGGVLYRARPKTRER